MGWDGAGNYNRVHNFSADASAGINILASRMDAEINDVASAFTRVWTRDGQNTPTTDLPMGGRKFVNVGAPTSVANFMRVREFIENVPIFMQDAESSADRISVSSQYFTSVSANQAPVDGTKIMVRVNSDKSSAVLYLDGHSANVEFEDGTRAAEAMVSGGIYEFTYSSVDTAWKLPATDRGKTAAERAAGVTPTNYKYEEGHFFRLGGVADGDGAGGGTNNATVLQTMFDLLRDQGVKPIFPRNGIIRCDSGLTLLSNDSSPYNYIIDFNGCQLDFKNISGSTIAWRLGATSQANAHDLEEIRISNVKLLGPETLDPGTPGNNPTTTTTGISMEYCLNVTFDNVACQSFYQARLRNFVFPFLSLRGEYKSNYIGDYVDDDCTRAMLIEDDFTSCRYPAVIRPSTVTKTISNQVYISPRFEQCTNGPVLDPRSGSGVGIHGVLFLEPYIEDVDYDIARIGLQWTFADPATRNSEATRSVYNCAIRCINGISGDTWTGTHAPLVLGSSGGVRGCDFILPASISDVVGTDIQYSDYRSVMSTSVGDSSSRVNQLVGEIRSNGLFRRSGTAQTLTGAGAVNITAAITWLVTTGANALTLADGAEGQEKFIVMKTDGGDGTLTPTNLYNGTTITFNDIGDSAHLFFTDGQWVFMGGTATLA